jgi:hypothetical protein
MFFELESKSNQASYVKLLQIVGSLSNLFSESDIPYLYYRVAENIFCRAFSANNYSRSDTSIDAGKNNFGFGLKTFIYKQKGQCYEKVAEFNKDRSKYKDINNPEELIQVIAYLRNTRIDFAKNSYDLDQMIYHCIVRQPGLFIIFEEVMNIIDINNIQDVKEKNNSIYFNDQLHEYSFNLSKSTLFKKFIINDQLYSFEVNKIEDPFTILETIYDESQEIIVENQQNFEFVILPLYSTRNLPKNVPEKSGLNQWNAGGRLRHNKEVYIPIPIWIHRKFPNFFPPRDVAFILKLPDNKTLSAKVCQDDSKALMSNPNKDLGEWLIDKVLRLPPGQIVTYEMLESIGIDSVEIRKINNDNFEIDFKKLDSYEDFKELFNH